MNHSMSGSGFWEPHTSSIDFCESNYLHSPYVAEVHNVWSSILGLSAVGMLGLTYGNPTGEARYTLLYVVLTIVGLGSACLHGTLHWLFQSSDELPMIYLVMCMTYSILECQSPIGKPRYPWLPSAMLLAALFNTLVYYKFQHLYFVFIATFFLLTTIATVGSFRLLFDKKLQRGPQPLELFWYGEKLFLGIGVPIWLVDMLLCPSILTIVDHQYYLPWILRGITPHVIWHCAAGLGAYVLSLSSVCCRLDALEIPYTLTYACGGFIPIVQKASINSNGSHNGSSNCNSQQPAEIKKQR